MLGAGVADVWWLFAAVVMLETDAFMVESDCTATVNCGVDEAFSATSYGLRLGVAAGGVGKVVAGGVDKVGEIVGGVVGGGVLDRMVGG